MNTTVEIAEAFSGHRFPEVYDRLADGVRWVLVGQGVIAGREAVVDACEKSAGEMAQLASTEFSRFVSVGDEHLAAVDAIGHYVGTDGSTSVVSSCDLYEFDPEGRVTVITSYAVELEG